MVTAYLAHGRAIGELFPGLSDFDLILIYDPAQNSSFVSEVRSVWNRTRQLIPVRDVSLMSRDDFNSWQQHGGGMDPLDELKHWILLSGKELRSSSTLALESKVAERDRQRYAFAGYHRLLRCALKDEANIHFLTITLRRQIYKSFCSSVLPLERKYLAIQLQAERLRQWGIDSGQREIVERLLSLKKARFHTGEVSRLSFDAAAHAYRALDEAAKLPQQFGTSSRLAQGPLRPIFNSKEIEARARRFTNELTRQFSDRFFGGYIVGNGSPRGYVLQLVLREGLSHHEIVETMRHTHEIFRLFDDPWYNEHFPVGVPFIMSQAMWKRALELWSFYGDFWTRHPIVVFGERILHTMTPLDEITFDDLEGERAALARYYQQTRMEASRPALFDFLTLHFPRYLSKKFEGVVPTTNEEAAAEVERIRSPHADAIRECLEKYRTLDIDSILREIPISLINENSTEVEASLASCEKGPR